MPKKIKYKSIRGIPLLFQVKCDRPTITLENYCKWYHIYIVYPDKSIEIVPYELIDDIQKTIDIQLTSDHIFHPYLLERLATHYDGIVDSISLETAYGRWMMEYKDILPEDLV